MITICDYIQSMVHEVNISNNYRAQVIYYLGIFSIYFKNAVLFKDMIRDNLLAYLGGPNGGYVYSNENKQLFFYQSNEGIEPLFCDNCRAHTQVDTELLIYCPNRCQD